MITFIRNNQIRTPTQHHPGHREKVRSFHQSPQIFSVQTSAETAALLEGLDLASLCITSSAELIAGTGETKIEVRRADGGKCARCWKQFSEIPEDNDSDICTRCQTVVAEQGAV